MRSGYRWLQIMDLYTKGGVIKMDQPTVVRSKWQCASMHKYESNVWDAEHKNVQTGILYIYEFYPVTSSSPENDQFFASTPYGSIRIGAVRDNLYQVGKYYYFDSAKAES